MPIRYPLLLLCILLRVLISPLAAAPAQEEVAFTINPAQAENRIDVRIYGQFLEHIFNSVHGGLWETWC